MEDVIVRLRDFMEQNKHNIEFICAQNGKIKEVMALINNTKPNKNHFFVIDGIWAHQKAFRRLSGNRHPPRPDMPRWQSRGTPWGWTP